ncbi:MAG: hypothetical protein ACRCWQ_01465 [Bacilli bacterium]
MLLGYPAPNLLSVIVTNKSSEAIHAVDFIIANEKVNAAGLKNIKENTNKVTGISTLILTETTSLCVEIDGSAPIVIAESVNKGDCYTLRVSVHRDANGVFSCSSEIEKEIVK